MGIYGYEVRVKLPEHGRPRFLSFLRQQKIKYSDDCQLENDRWAYIFPEDPRLDDAVKGFDEIYPDLEVKIERKLPGF